MLVLSRKQHEEICIDGQITIRVVRVIGNRVQLGIEAPQDVRIQRAELLLDFDENFAVNRPVLLNAH